MSVILVTGGAGFIGTNFVRHLLAQTDSQVVVLDALTYAGHRASLADVELDARVTFLQGDVADRASSEAVLRQHRPTWIVNFAAESHVDRSIDGPRDFVRTNIVGTFELLEASRAHHAALSAKEKASFRFLQISTDEVYGSLGTAGYFDENSAYAPRSPYSASKAGADHLVSSYFHTFGLPVLIANCSNNYGPYQFPEKLIPLVILNALEGKPLPIYGDGLNVRDWLYVGDTCEAVLQLARRGRIGDRYNVGAGCERTTIEVVDTVCSILDELVPPEGNLALQGRGLRSYADLKAHVVDRPGHDRRYALDARKSRRELGWEPRFEFLQGMSATVEWYLGHRDWCALVQGTSDARQRLGLGKRIV